MRSVEEGWPVCSIEPEPVEVALRACLVRVRVRMVLYAFSYEKDISYRPFRHRVDSFAFLPAYPKGPGKTTHPLPT